MCFQFHHNLGFEEKEDQNWKFKFSVFTTLIVIILAILSLLFLAPAGNIQLFFMLVDFLQLYFIWGLRAKKSFNKKRILKNLKFVSFDFTPTSWLTSLFAYTFKLKEHEIVNTNFVNKITDYDIKSTSSPVFAYEDFLQYGKTGHFLIDCSHIIEAYLYYFLFCLITKGVYSLFKRFLNPDSLILINMRNVQAYLVSRKFLFRIFNETYVFLLLYGLYMELNIYFPLKKENLFILNETHVIVNKVIQRLMVTLIGFGFPTYLISRIVLHGKGDKIDRDLRFMISGCKI